MKKIKICGTKFPDNIGEVLTLKPDYIGFIFYPGSARFVESLEPKFVRDISGVVKTGVFVNEEADKIKQIIAEYGLGAVQLHGKESPDVCRELKDLRISVIKAFGIDETFDWPQLAAYQDAVDFFLFDTQTKQHGGSGKVFDWQLLAGYTLDTPYFLSGGISAENIESAANIKDERLHALDLNSKFEGRPGFKNITLLKNTLQRLHHE